MPRGKTSFVCKECGYSSPGWLGKCPGCGSWNTIEETIVPAFPAGKAGTSVSGRAGTAGGRPLGGGIVGAFRSDRAGPIRLSDIDGGAHGRIDTGVGELNRVLGGGLVAGSVVLLGGEPGIGKSTLLLQALLKMQQAAIPSLLVSGEESPGQVKLRSARLQGADRTAGDLAATGGAAGAGRRHAEAGAGAAAHPGLAAGAADNDLRLLPETQVEAVVAHLQALRPAVCVVDSVQTLWSSEIGSTPGSVAQIRETASQLLQAAKSNGIGLILVGHVTKEGDLAGPRVLEHMVDAVLSFDGERGQPFRILRAVKNRFGSTNEVGVFEMSDRGLVEVPDPSSLFLEEGELRSGSAVAPVLEGTRCLLAEVQALVSPSNLVAPQRVARGFDRNRLAMIVAVLGRRARIPLSKSDIFVNVAGGLAIEDPAADLALALAIASAWRDAPLDEGVAAFGEISLTGKVRYVLQGDKRVHELARRGFKRVLLPGRNLEEIQAKGAAPRGMVMHAVTDIGEAVRDKSG